MCGLSLPSGEPFSPLLAERRVFLSSLFLEAFWHEGIFKVVVLHIYVEGKKPRHFGLFEAATAFPRGGSSENRGLSRPQSSSGFRLPRGVAVSMVGQVKTMVLFPVFSRITR